MKGLLDYVMHYFLTGVDSDMKGLLDYVMHYIIKYMFLKNQPPN